MGYKQLIQLWIQSFALTRRTWKGIVIWVGKQVAGSVALKWQYLMIFTCMEVYLNSSVEITCTY